MASIIKRCDGGDWDGCPHPWVVRYRTDGGRTSKQREQSFGDDLREAEDFLLKVEHDKKAHVSIDPEAGKAIFRAETKAWLSQRIGADSSDMTYRSVLRTHVYPAIDGMIRTPAPPHIVEQLIAVRDIGAYAAIAFANPGGYAGQALELAGDELTVPQIAAAMTTALGRPIRYSQIPIEEIRRADPGRAASLERLYNLEPPRANISYLRDQHAELLTFEQWLTADGAGQIAAYLESASHE